MQNTLLNMRGQPELSVSYPELVAYQSATSQIIIFFFYSAIGAVANLSTITITMMF